MKKLILTCLCLAFVAGNALAEWQPGDPYKMHFPQLPDPAGWDVHLQNYYLADDFDCNESGPLTDIHFWISWQADSIGEVTDWVIYIFSDNAGQPDQAGNLWVLSPPYDYEVVPAGIGLQGWLYPDLPFGIPDDHTQYFQVNITNIEQPFIQTEGQRYWLLIWADSVSAGQVGWKTTDIAFAFGSPALWLWDIDNWIWIPVETGFGPPVDMAFVVTNDAPLGACCFNTGDCVSETAYNCNALGGHWHGPGTLCEPNPCAPYYCDTTWSNCPSPLDLITNVTFNTIDNDSGDECATQSYGDYTYLSTQVSPLSTHTLSVTFFSSGDTDYVRAWVDWNQDYDFDDPGEQYDIGSGANTTVSSDINVPADALPGPTRMRVTVMYDAYPGPCDNGEYGETEDYTVIVTGPDNVHNITKDRWYWTIQAAIDDANNADQIEVLPETYEETVNFNGMAVHIFSTEGPELTIIDGTGNYHVVQCVSGEDANTVLEGFTITGGNATDGGGMYNVGSSPTIIDCNFISNDANYGGGMYNYNNSSPTIIDCNFIGNNADHGGGMLNIDGNPTVTGCTFKNNVASSGAIGGGGMYNHNSSPLVTDCAFIDNSGGSYGGGGMFNAEGSNPKLINCTFRNNNAVGRGGGIYNWYDTMPILINCTFSGNSATDYGGGMFNYHNSPTVNNCTFSGNSTTFDGGGMHNDYYSSPTVNNCTFSFNSAAGGGGMGNTSHSNPVMTNCTFRGNSATAGGGIVNNDKSSPTVNNCTFSGNSAAEGGGMYNSDSNSTVTNCILWSNSPDEIYNNSSSPIVTYSDVQGGYAGIGNIDADPCFVDVNNPDPNLWNLRLKPDSPCIDAADSAVLLTLPVIVDLDGNVRYFDIVATTNTGSGPLEFLDMGAYEFQCSGIPGDINCDGVVNFKDLAIIAENWLVGL